MLLDPFNEQIKNYLEEEIKELDKVGGLTKIDALDSIDLNDYLVNIYNYPELEHFVLKNGDNYDLFLRYRSDFTNDNISEMTDFAFNSYRKKDYSGSVKKSLTILRKAAAPKYEIYGLIGLDYKALGDEEKANDYFRIYNYLIGEKDYNQVDVDGIKERVEIKMKNTKKNNYNQFNIESDRQVHIDRLSIPNFDDIIAYMEKNQMDIETAGKELGLTNEQIDIIKLIFAREFYKQGDIEKGNSYLNSVEKTSGKTSDVTRLCLEARTNKRFFQYRDNNEPKKLSLIKPGKRK